MSKTEKDNLNDKVTGFIDEVSSFLKTISINMFDSVKSFGKVFSSFEDLKESIKKLKSD